LDFTNPQSGQFFSEWAKLKIIATVPRSGQPSKIITPTASCVIVCEVSEESKVTHKQLQAILTLANANADESPIKGTLRISGAFRKECCCLSAV